MTTTTTVQVVRGCALLIFESTVEVEDLGVNASESLEFTVATGVENLRTDGVYRRQGSTESGTESTTRLQGLRMLSG